MAEVCNPLWNKLDQAKDLSITFSFFSYIIDSFAFSKVHCHYITQKESYPVEPLRLKAKSRMQIIFPHLHFWLLSKILSNLGLTTVFRARFVQFQPLLSVTYEHSEIFVLFIYDHSYFTLNILLRAIYSVSVSAQM